MTYNTTTYNTEAVEQFIAEHDALKAELANAKAHYTALKEQAPCTACAQLAELREAALTLCEWASCIREHVDAADDPSTDDYAACNYLRDAEYAVRGLLPKVKP